MFDPIDQSVLQNLDPPFLFNAEHTLSQCDKSLPKGATADLDFFFTKSLTACGQACNEFNRNLTKSDTAPGNFNGTKYFCNAAEWSVKPQFSWGVNCWIKVIKNICARPPKNSKELTFVSMITHLPNADCASCFFADTVPRLDNVLNLTARQAFSRSQLDNPPCYPRGHA